MNKSGCDSNVIRKFNFEYTNTTYLDTIIICSQEINEYKPFDKFKIISNIDFIRNNLLIDKPDTIINIYYLDTNTNCSDTIIHVINGYNCDYSIYLPTAFTPNGDVSNNAFHIGSTNIVEFSIDIYNRWGQLVFNSTDPEFTFLPAEHGLTTETQDVFIYVVKFRYRRGKFYKSPIIEKRGVITALQ